MGSSFHYNVMSGFRAVDAWQQVIVQNVQGLLQPGYNRQKLHIGQGGGSIDGNVTNQAGTQANGSQATAWGGGDSLFLNGTTLQFEQGTIDPAFSTTALAIRGEGFFMLAENDLPGARVFLSRAGDFKYDAQGRLVNPNGLFVVGGRGQVQLDDNGRIIGPPPFILNPGDNTVDLPQVSLAKVKAPSGLGISGYGNTVYDVTGASGPMAVFPNGQQPEVGFVQANSLEMPSRIGWSGIYQTETIQATQTYKIFKDMLTEFNKTTDDAINLVK